MCLLRLLFIVSGTKNDFSFFILFIYWVLSNVFSFSFNFHNDVCFF